MKKITLYLLILLYAYSCKPNKETDSVDFITKFEKSNGTETATYQETISFYENLAKTYTSVAIYSMRNTDSGKPLHVVTFNPDRSFESARESPAISRRRS